MSEIKTLEDMRNTVKTIAADCDEGWILGCLDAIESEIAERYMELPVDADGVPIHVGEEITLPNGRRDTVRFITYRMTDVVFNERGWIPNQCTHVKPRTVEDVLREFAYKVCDLNIADCDVERYAAEMRELLRGDVA